MAFWIYCPGNNYSRKAFLSMQLCFPSDPETALSKNKCSGRIAIPALSNLCQNVSHFSCTKGAVLINASLHRDRILECLFKFNLYG